VLLLTRYGHANGRQDECKAGDTIKPSAELEKPCLAAGVVKKTEPSANQAKSMMLIDPR
jgi:hypothetical protein